jgi:hypothetical protein
VPIDKVNNRLAPRPNSSYFTASDENCFALGYSAIDKGKQL